MRYILSLDQGTTSSRALLFDHHGAVRSVAQREFKQIFPEPGWVEHDPEEIAASQIAVALEALAKINAQPSDVAAIGITNQRETTIVWDRATGKPIYNAIVWQDRRTAAFCQQLKAERPRETDTAAHRVADRRLLLRQQDFLDSRTRAATPANSRKRAVLRLVPSIPGSSGS